MAVIALDNTLHADMRIRPASNYSHLRTMQYLPVLVHEFARAASEYPVIFMKHAETGQFRVVALFGLEPESNLFVESGHWQGNYLPSIVRQAPLKLIADATNPDQLTVAIDDESEQVSQDEGQRLFEANGEESEFLKTRKEALVSYIERDQITQAFVALLSKHELLRADELSVQLGGELQHLGGVYAVDEQRLGTLDDEAYLDLRSRGFIAPIYAHLISLNQVRHLVRRQAGA